MRIDNKYRMYWANGDYVSILKRSDHIRQYSITNTENNGTYRASFTATGEGYGKNGYKSDWYWMFGEYGDYYTVDQENNFSYVNLPIPTEQFINLNQFNYWNGAVSYTLNFDLSYPSLPIIQFRLNNKSVDATKVKNISITSISKSITPICKISWDKKYIHKHADTDNKILLLTVETPSDMPQGLQCFYACLPPNDFPANDLTFTITYTRNGVEETVTKTNTNPLQLRHGMKAINIDIA